jgi:hypothetical protein
MRFTQCIIYVFAVCTVAQSAEDGVPVLTVCQALASPHAFAKRNLVIVGRLMGTDEGAWLDQDCSSNPIIRGNKVVVAGKEYPTAISFEFSPELGPPPSFPKAFGWNRSALQAALHDVKETTLHEGNSRWYAVYGRLENTIPWVVSRTPEGIVTRNGYGHLNSAPAALITAENTRLELKRKACWAATGPNAYSQILIGGRGRKRGLQFPRGHRSKRNAP